MAAQPAVAGLGARIDGANIFQTYWRVVLPLARPGIATLAILSFQGTWNEFLLPLVVVRASPNHWTLPFGLSTLGRGGAGEQTFERFSSGASPPEPSRD